MESGLLSYPLFPTVSRFSLNQTQTRSSSLIDKVYIDSPNSDFYPDIHRRYDIYESRPKSSRPPFLRVHSFDIYLGHLFYCLFLFIRGLIVFLSHLSPARIRALACLGLLLLIASSSFRSLLFCIGATIFDISAFDGFCFLCSRYLSALLYTLTLL